MVQKNNLKFTSHKHLIRPGSPTHPCEDLVHINDTWLLLMDGASPLAPSIMEPSDAAVFVCETSRILKRSLPGHNRPLTEILSTAMEEVLSRWPGFSAEMPSAGIALVRLVGSTLEYFLLGDCTISIEKKDGTFLLIEDDSLHRLDTQALTELKQHATRLQTSPRDCLPLIQDTLIRNRSLRNTPDGYYILDPSGLGIVHAKKGTLPAADTQSIFLCSDGFVQLCEFTKESLPDLHKRAKKQGLSPLLDELYQFQDQDTSFHRVARFKHRDDASCILAMIPSPKGVV